VSTDYDFIAEQYKRAKLQPWRTHVETFTFLQHIGNLDGKNVLDLACGEGFYSRVLKSRGARDVTGVDLSEKMIALARRQEEETPLGVHYEIGDAKTLRSNKQYDLIVAAYLLNYAANPQELGAMLQTISHFLKPGGRFVTVNSNPHLDFSSAPSYKQYGFETAVSGEWKEQAPIKWRFHLEETVIEIENYYLSAATHENACRAAGLHSIRWHRPTLSEAGVFEYGAEYWSPLLSQPPLICLECSK
jgi:ubiquinone/menaquinone biosynthesis C-methylase UbiE